MPREDGRCRSLSSAALCDVTRCGTHALQHRDTNYPSLNRRFNSPARCVGRTRSHATNNNNFSAFRQNDGYYHF